MTGLIDANILLRRAEPGHPQCQIAKDAVNGLWSQGYDLYIVPQSIYEFWVVATRPAAVNGLGFTPSQAAAEVARLRLQFELLDDTPDIYTTWLDLVTNTPATGKPSHDARLVAAMLVHGIAHILTFNDADFRRYPSITAVYPATVTPPGGS